MSKSDTITVYWGPAERLPYQSRNNMLHRKPESLLSFIHGERTPDAQQVRCPAIKDRLDNVFVMKSAINDSFDFNLDEAVAIKDSHAEHLYDVDSPFRVIKSRVSNLKDYYPATYMLSWYFFASEPLMAKFTAPYYPSFSPIKGALLATGEYDIGRWFRPVALDYHIPIDQSHFELHENDPVMFVEFMTDKKVVFKRFEPEDILHSLAIEFASTPTTVGPNLSLEERYDHAKESEMTKVVLANIKKNLV